MFRSDLRRAVRLDNGMPLDLALVEALEAEEADELDEQALQLLPEQRRQHTELNQTGPLGP